MNLDELTGMPKLLLVHPRPRRLPTRSPTTEVNMYPVAIPFSSTEASTSLLAMQTSSPIAWDRTLATEI